MPRDVDVVTHGNSLDGKRILLGITGGIAAVESVRLGRELRRHGAEIHVIMTEAATKVITPLAVRWATQSPVDVEWSGDMPQLEGFDAILVAPATRNTLSKHANGVMDSPLSMALAAGTGNGTPILVVPSMHNDLFDDPVTTDLLEIIKSRGCSVLISESEEGRRKQPSPEDIVSRLSHIVNRDDNSRRILVMIGGTEVPIDDVRTVSNHSTGRTGWSIADYLYRQGHDVFVLAGKISFEPKTICFPVFRSMSPNLMKETTKQMIENDKMEIDSVVCAAAISDFVVSDFNSGKIKSGHDISLNLSPFEKILDQIPQWLKLSRGDKTGHVIGFKLLANSNRDELVSAARSQIDRVGVSAVVANDSTQLNGDGPRALWVTTTSVDELDNVNNIAEKIDFMMKN
ncbi:MAG: bifunctional phosphopantothenoylcysteine decarboxylase/phosphopantothenate--cysteine ligase CoaBC [Candidatus Thermoplasmatota archaeon]|nr:bifunctional phosphopantothenoylcysteine decarboxylase/phosphopantothenate--cysteine ligase CoaBC [Candidatus Thermoplasmatota archaeon]